MFAAQLTFPPKNGRILNILAFYDFFFIPVNSDLDFGI